MSFNSTMGAIENVFAFRSLSKHYFAKFSFLFFKTLLRTTDKKNIHIDNIVQIVTTGRSKSFRIMVPTKEGFSTNVIHVF